MSKRKIKVGFDKGIVLDDFKSFKTSIVKCYYDLPYGLPNYLAFERGWGNGYVFVSIDHPLHGKDYDTANNSISVHGGLTFSKICDASNYSRFGVSKDCIGMWVFGFDTAHGGDGPTNCHLGKVQSETDMLLVQIVGQRTVGEK